MKSIGIVCEYNPFHNGHIYHINKIKEMFPDSVIILVMSGSFTQRGDASIINKWNKTKIALNHNIDLVIELPFIFTNQSADTFAFGACSILNYLKVDYLVFGSESDNIDYIKNIVNIEDNKKYQEKVKELLDNGINYPTALSKALNTSIDLLVGNDIQNLLEQKVGNVETEIIKNNKFQKIIISVLSIIVVLFILAFILLA